MDAVDKSAGLGNRDEVGSSSRVGKVSHIINVQSAVQQPVCKCVAAGIGGQVFPMTRLHAPFARSVVSEAPRLAVHVPAWQADASWSVGTAGRNGACMHVHAHKRCTTCQGNRKVPQAGGCRRWRRRAQHAHIIACVSLPGPRVQREPMLLIARERQSVPGMCWHPQHRCNW